VDASSLPVHWHLVGSGPDEVGALERFAKRLVDAPLPAVGLVDDVHLLVGPGATQALAFLVDERPAGLDLVLAGRELPALPLSRTRLNGGLVEVGVDDLRFRTWEVDQLFRQVLGADLAPEQVAALARKTDGWAACLQLFWLAAEGRRPVERDTILAGLGTRSRLVREYLVENVLAALPPSLRDFLMRTSVFSELTVDRCAALLGSGPGTEVLQELEELERRFLLSAPLDGSAVYRCHEMLRGHLREQLERVLGHEEARTWHAKAAALLEAEGRLAEAVGAHIRAGDLGRVRALLASGDSVLDDGAPDWTELLPASLQECEPWVLMARARSLADEGAFGLAADAYRRAAGLFATEEMRALAHERSTWLDAFADPFRLASFDPALDAWPIVLRRALVHDPARVLLGGRLAQGPQRVEGADGSPGAADPTTLLVGALAAWLAGDPRRCRLLLAAVPLHPAASLRVSRIAALGLGLLDRLVGAHQPGPCLDLVDALERDGPSLAARLARRVAGLPLPAPPVPALHRSRPASVRAGDGPPPPLWAQALIALVDGLLELAPDEDPRQADVAGRPAAGREPPRHRSNEPFERAARCFEQLHAEALAAVAWALLAAKQVVEGVPAADAHLAKARRAARVARCGLAIAVVERAERAVAPSTRRGAARPEAGSAEVLAVLRGFLAGWPSEVPDHHRPGRRDWDDDPSAARPRVPVEDDAGGDDRPGSASAGGGLEAGPVVAPRIAVRLHGAFSLGSREADAALGRLKPRARLVLARLALAWPDAVHREAIMDELWGEAEPTSALRALQVAVSAARHVVRAIPGADVERAGEAYRLLLPEDATTDAVAVRAARPQARRLLAAGDVDGAVGLLASVLGACSGELLGDLGPEEWLDEPRRRAAEAVAVAAVELARLSIERGDPKTALWAAQQGLATDRYRDELWRLCIDAHERLGNPAAARSAAARYDAILEELGVARS
jgi:DNA-binding SARP family transcriptional activator